MGGTTPRSPPQWIALGKGIDSCYSAPLYLCFLQGYLQKGLPGKRPPVKKPPVERPTVKSTIFEKKSPPLLIWKTFQQYKLPYKRNISQQHFQKRIYQTGVLQFSSPLQKKASHDLCKSNYCSVSIQLKYPFHKIFFSFTKKSLPVFASPPQASLSHSFSVR